MREAVTTENLGSRQLCRWLSARRPNSRAGTWSALIRATMWRHFAASAGFPSSKARSKKPDSPQRHSTRWWSGIPSINYRILVPSWNRPFCCCATVGFWCCACRTAPALRGCCRMRSLLPWKLRRPFDVAMACNNLLTFPYLYGYSALQLERLTESYGFRLATLCAGPGRLHSARSSGLVGRRGRANREGALSGHRRPLAGRPVTTIPLSPLARLCV